MLPRVALAGDGAEFPPGHELVPTGAAETVISGLPDGHQHDAKSFAFGGDGQLYVEVGSPGMCGVLIYTAAPDADGTLGGLVRQGRSDRLEPLLRAAVDRSRWCAADPLCMSGVASLSDGLNGAACHACAMVPETSCSFRRPSGVSASR